MSEWIPDVVSGGDWSEALRQGPGEDLLGGGEPVDEVFDHEAFDTQMDASGLIAAVLGAGDAERAVSMSSYMRDQFTFIGVNAARRRALQKSFFALAKNDSHADWSFVSVAWAYPYRELQYTAVDYLRLMGSKLSVLDVPRLRTLVESKSWWDTVDGLAKVFAIVLAGNRRVVGDVREWSRAENVWTRRVAIISQLGFRERTDTGLLAETIDANLGSDEFVINKAIGWALREYSATDPKWVREFIAERPHLAPLSIREASKYLEG